LLEGALVVFLFVVLLVAIYISFYFYKRGAWAPLFIFLNTIITQ